MQALFCYVGMHDVNMKLWKVFFKSLNLYACSNFLLQNGSGVKMKTNLNIKFQLPSLVNDILVRN